MTSKERNPRIAEISPLLYTRVAGFIGIIMLLSGSLSSYIGSKLIVHGNPVATSRNLMASEFLFRLGIVSSLIMIGGWTLYALVLFSLLKPVNERYATFMLMLVLLCVPIFMLNQLNQLAALLLAVNQKHAQMMFFLDLHRYGNIISGIFFGLWLFPLGFLVFKSGYFPKILGVLLMIGCLGYLILFVQAFLFPGSENTLWTNPALVVTHISELSLMLWLLIKGVNVEQWEKGALGPCR